MERSPIAAGAFYPADKQKLERQLNFLSKGLPEQKKTRCVVAPHAGYVYSGKTAAYSFNALKKNATFVVLGPNHSGLGEEISVSDAGSWITPLGKVEVDKTLREKLLSSLGIEADDLAHIQEHSLEVQLPFLQHFFTKLKVLPITLGTHSLEKLALLGNALAELGENFSIVASGDFTHHETLDSAKKKDLAAIEKIKALDLKAFHSMVLERNLSICGLAPITAAMEFCKKMGLKEAKLFKYDTSATATGETESVVGYASIGFY